MIRGREISPVSFNPFWELVMVFIEACLSFLVVSTLLLSALSVLTAMEADDWWPWIGALGAFAWWLLR